LEISGELPAGVDYARNVSEWLILVLLVPAITVPVVLLVGFVGCHFRPRTAYPPIIDSAIGQGLDAVTVTWHLDPTDPDVSAAQTFFVERTRPNGHVDDPFQIFASPFEDTGLPTSNNVSEVYKYRVGRQLMIDTSPDWSTQVSSPTSLVTFGGPHFLDAGGSIALSPGFCLIQRIEPSQFIYGGPGLNVQIVLHGGSGGGLSIDRIYISQAGGTKPYDAGSDLTPVLTTPLLVNANQVVPIPVVTYSLDHNQPLLIAFDLTPAGPAQVRFLDLPQPPPGPGVTSYLSPAAAAEAAIPTRSANYLTGPNRLVCIEIIGVGLPPS
jgi:hypothetical protein